MMTAVNPSIELTVVSRLVGGVMTAVAEWTDYSAHSYRCQLYEYESKSVESVSRVVQLMMLMPMSRRSLVSSNRRPREPGNSQRRQPGRNRNEENTSNESSNRSEWMATNLHVPAIGLTIANTMRYPIKKYKHPMSAMIIR